MFTTNIELIEIFKAPERLLSQKTAIELIEILKVQPHLAPLRPSPRPAQQRLPLWHLVPRQINRPKETSTQ